MEKTLTYEEQRRIKNLLTKIKGQLSELEIAKDSVYESLNEINDILNKV